ncbi:MAG: hypothetical protein RLZZ224_441 [Verrucomicrobiota bacterium]|jgi:3-hydroxyisobutyrate dehydrogenase/glyoxylate/succinic semialdehyde reductase
MRITVLGMGIIGARCADHWQTAGHQVTRWNRTPKDLDAFTSNALDAARASDILSFYLKDSQALREVFTSIKSALHTRHFLMNHSTVDLATTQWIAAQCAEIGCQFVDAPFTGSKQAAQDGALCYFLSGSTENIEKAAQILEPTSTQCLAMGEIGRATVFKLSTNLIAACQVQALAEAQALCLHHGIQAQEFAAALASHGTTSPLTRLKLPSMLNADYETHFSLDNMRKDSTYALALAAEKHLILPAMQAVSSRMTELCQQGLGDYDYSALAQPYQSMTSQ